MPTELRVWLRRVAGQPAAFVAAVASLALGMGAVVAVHAIVEATLVAPIRGVTLDAAATSGIPAVAERTPRTTTFIFRAASVPQAGERLGAAAGDWPGQ